MEAVEIIMQLNGAPVVAQSKKYWLPEGELRVINLSVLKSNVVFDLLVPTGKSDIWDYIWRSEKERGTTNKVQIFQDGQSVTGSQITTISREGEEGWDAVGPEQYRLKFVVPLTALKAEKPIEVRYFWEDELIATARGSQTL